MHGISWPALMILVSNLPTYGTGKNAEKDGYASHIDAALKTEGKFSG